jgi:crotonobetainyl-CoA:carnitine CoA-transferase CaiB-like acyl-CoA transferase
MPDGPLTGVFVLDFTRILAGPYATMLLADLGAEVVKVERPGVGDDTRSWGPPFHGVASTYFAAINRGKRSIAVDLATPKGLELARALAQRADVIVENFSPGVMGRLGLGYDELRACNPGLIYATINGFGSSGPKARDVGTEVIVEAESGLMAMMGVPGGPPVRFGVAMVDIATGLALVSGVLAGMLERARTSRGRQIEFPLYATAISVLGTVIASASVDPSTQVGRWGSAHPSIVPYAAFAAADGYIVLGAINDEMWRRMVDALALDDLRNDPRVATNAERVQNRELVEDAIIRAIADQSMAEIERRLQAVRVLVAPVRSPVEAIDAPQVHALDLIESVDGLRLARTPLAQFADGPLAAAPALGADTRDVLTTRLGLDRKRLDTLVTDGVLDDGRSAILTPAPHQSQQANGGRCDR